MLYAILKLIYKISLWVFFRKFEVRYKVPLPDRGPLLLVSNHPNTFMDPIVIASLLQQPVYFISKSTVFGSGITNWLLRNMHLIPIHRREDSPDKPVNNDEAFAASFQALADGKSIIIFPEGNSFNERRLRKIKTGTARIALGAEASTQAGVKIVPIGLNYSDPTRFRSRVFVNMGEPITVTNYLQTYQDNPTETVLALTDEIRIRLEELIIHTPSDEDNELAQRIGMIYKNRLVIDHAQVLLDQEKEFVRTKAIVNSIQYFKQQAPEQVEAVSKKIKVYMEQLQNFDLRDGVLQKDAKEVIKQGTLASLYLLLGFPLYLYGLLHNYIPYIIPSLIARRLTREQEWYAPIMLTVGIFSFPLLYILYGWVFWQLQLLPSIAWLSLYFISFPLSGFFALSYWYTLRYTKEHWILYNLFSNKNYVFKKLKNLRHEIIKELETAQQEYQEQLSTFNKEVS